jgi:LPS export ABC transporter protein LptC
MQEIGRKKATVIGLRAHLPLVTRVVAIIMLGVGVGYIVVSYYRLRNNKPFRLKSGEPELSKQVVGVVEGYERRENRGDRLWMLLRAARDVTFSDGHHELENVYLEVYPLEGANPDKISAHRSITDEKISRITFTGDVNIETHDALVARTEAVSYDRDQNIAEATAPITFTRENVSGRAASAVIETKNKRVELKGDVEITVAPQTASAAHPAKTGARSRPALIRAARAEFDQGALRLKFTGGATVEQERDVMSGDTLMAALNEQKRVQKIEARGNAYLRTMEEGRAAEVHAAAMDFFFDDDQRLERAVATRDVTSRSLSADSEMGLTAGNLEAHFQAQGERSILREMNVDGRPVVTLSAPQSRASDPRAANKRLTADTVKLFWREQGRDLERAEAAGNAELVIEPVQKTETAERKTLLAPRFDGEFYETDNQLRVFTATGGARAHLEPLRPSEKRIARTLVAERMTATFVRETQDVERIDAQGDARFDQGERHGRAASASYTAADGMVRLRGGEPVAWDERARIKAAEIDTDTRQEITYARGKVSTTYYSQEQTGGAAPFGKVKSPVFIVSDRAEFGHTTGVAVYTGNARAWQDDNFVRADKITLRRESKTMEGEGHVQSVLYQAKGQSEKGERSTVPVFASADRIAYSDVDRVVKYNGNVDIKQGTERLTSDEAEVYLLKDVYEVERMIAQRHVVLTQPGRNGVGEWAQYTAADETVVLKGEPARVQDAEQGTSESRRLTVYLRDSKVVADDAGGPQATGRVRSTHRIRKP